jgi:uncharacterized protein (TIGR03067 family)
MVRFCFPVIAMICVLLGSAAAQNDAVKKDLESLQGVWRIVSMEGGYALAAEKLKEMKLTIRGNKASHLASEGQTEEATIKLDPSKKPKAIDFTPQTGPDKAKNLLGIYAIDGDTLRICATIDGGDRPTEFKASKEASLIVLKREKQ